MPQGAGLELWAGQYSFVRASGKDNEAPVQDQAQGGTTLTQAAWAGGTLQDTSTKRPCVLLGDAVSMQTDKNTTKSWRKKKEHFLVGE